jgi:hypothetical protein
MYIVSSKKPRKTNRKRSARYRAKLKAKNVGRRARLFAWKTKKKRTTKAKSKKKR